MDIAKIWHLSLNNLNLLHIECNTTTHSIHWLCILVNKALV